MKEIRKKAYPVLFNEIRSGNKTFDLRIADFDCQPGDILILEEIDEVTKTPTGRELRKQVGYVLRTKDVNFYTPEDINNYGYQVLSLLDM